MSVHHKNNNLNNINDILCEENITPSYIKLSLFQYFLLNVLYTFFTVVILEWSPPFKISESFLG
jgi:hypothetical protein